MKYLKKFENNIEGKDGLFSGEFLLLQVKKNNVAGAPQDDAGKLILVQVLEDGISSTAYPTDVTWSQVFPPLKYDTHNLYYSPARHLYVDGNNWCYDVVFRSMVREEVKAKMLILDDAKKFGI